MKLVSHNGNRFFVRAGTCDEIVLRDDYAVERRRLYDLALRAGDLVVDAGAHIGSFAIPLGGRFPQATVVALEPASENFALLRRNVELNDLTNVNAERAALGAREGTETLRFSEESWAHTTDAEAPVGGSGTEPVPAVPIGRLLERNGRRRIALLKMNIEGGEYPVILQTPAAVLRRVARIELEFHPHPRHRGADLAQRLRTEGFEVELHGSRNEPGKGWISARKCVLP